MSSKRQNAVKCNLTKLTTKRSWYLSSGQRSAVGRAGSVPPSIVACFSMAYRSGFCSWAWSFPAGFLLLSWSIFSYLAFLWLNSLSFGLDGAEFVVVSVLILCRVRRTTVWPQPCSMAKVKLFHQLGRTLCPRQGHPFYRPDKTSVLAATHWPRQCQKR